MAALLAAAGAQVRAEFEALPDTVAAFHPAPGEWCPRECLGHMIEAERRGFGGRIQRILAAPGQPEVPWDQQEVQRQRGDCTRPTSELLAEFTEMREHNVALVRTLRPGQFDLACVHGKVGRLTIADLLHEWPFHDRNHFRQVQAAVQAYLWPSMRAAQGFVGE